MAPVTAWLRQRASARHLRSTRPLGQRRSPSGPTPLSLPMRRAFNSGAWACAIAPIRSCGGAGVTIDSAGRKAARPWRAESIDTASAEDQYWLMRRDTKERCQ